MRKKIIIDIVIITAVAAGAWILISNNYSFSDQPSDSDGASLPYGSDQGIAPAPQANQQADQDATTPPVASATDMAVKEFTVASQGFSFAPSALAVKKGDIIKILFKNTGGTHDFIIDEFNAATKRIKTGEEDAITFVADKTGSFEFYCSVGSHRQMGMKGTLTVTE